MRTRTRGAALGATRPPRTARRQLSLGRVDEMHTDVPDLLLVQPNVERDAPVAVEWLCGDAGRTTMRLMGNNEDNVGPTTLDAERKRVQGFIDSADQLTWMLHLQSRTVGVIWVDLTSTRHVRAPGVHIMIGEVTARGRGVGRGALVAVVNHLRQIGQYKRVHSRHLESNLPATRLLQSVGFDDVGEPYKEDDGPDLFWQNMQMDIQDVGGQAKPYQVRQVVRLAERYDLRVEKER